MTIHQLAFLGGVWQTVDKGARGFGGANSKPIPPPFAPSMATTAPSGANK